MQIQNEGKISKFDVEYLWDRSTFTGPTVTGLSTGGKDFFFEINRRWEITYYTAFISL